MLNLELIDNLYASLSKERQQELTTQLFKKSKQTMGYFHRTKDISLSKLEVLADFFGMPLDYFRMESSFKAKNLQTNGDGSMSVNMWLMMENKSLNMKIESQETIIDAKDETIKAQSTIIQLLRAQLDNAVARDGQQDNTVARDSDHRVFRDLDDEYFYNR